MSDATSAEKPLWTFESGFSWEVLEVSSPPPLVSFKS